jgi:hypothetical protein
VLFADSLPTLFTLQWPGAMLVIAGGVVLGQVGFAFLRALFAPSRGRDG